MPQFSFPICLLLTSNQPSLRCFKPSNYSFDDWSRPIVTSMFRKGGGVIFMPVRTLSIMLLVIKKAIELASPAFAPEISLTRIGHENRKIWRDVNVKIL